MAMSLTKITQSAGVKYLLSTVATGDVRHKGSSAMHSYYMATGTPPGKWLGRGAEEIGLSTGGVVTEEAATALFERFEHPLTGRSLTGQGRVLHEAKDDEASGKKIAGFDLTFTVPKSVSIVWAAADEETQRAILAAHHAAIAQTIEWIEDEVASTRSGRGGVVPSTVRGLVAARYDHWDTRNGDPHLHSHVAVANRVQRAHDGKWLTVNSAALYRASVAASELHENLLLDELHRSLGMTFHESARPSRSKAVVMDVDGVPDHVIEHMSSRATQVKALTADLVAQWEREHPGRTVGDRLLHRLSDKAWKDTRRPKAKVQRSLRELVERWRGQIRDAGVDPAEISTTRGPAPGTPTSAIAHEPVDLAGRVLDTLVEESVEARAAGVRRAASQAVENVMASSSTWRVSQVRAEANRLTRLVRASSPEARLDLVETITQAALDQCVELSPDRYRFTQPVTGHPVLDTGAGRVTLNDVEAKVFTHARVLNAEAYLMNQATTSTPTPLTVPDEVVREVLDELDAREKYPLAPDQRAAVERVVATGSMVSGIVGPAGTGKTTTVRAIRSVWEAQNGPGSMLALATSGRAATELAEATGIEATTVAKLLYENTPDRVAHRHEKRASAATVLAAATGPRARARARRILAALDVEEAAYRLRPGQLIVVDEASMTGTFDLAQIARLAEDAGARILLVGDPAQLDSPSAGGFLGWMDREHHVARLKALYRFADPIEAEATLRLRAGDPSVILPPPPPDVVEGSTVAGFYQAAGRIHDGLDENVLDGAYTATRDALAKGRTAILVAATNAQVEDLNTRATLDRRAAGLVDTTRTAALRTGMDAGTGDIILTRTLDRRVRDTQGRYVNNGDLFRITQVAPDGRVHAHRPDGTPIVLEAAWLAHHGELGYATTAHRAQGITVDEAHLVITSTEKLPREMFYVAMSRGRYTNHVWVGLMDAHQAHDNNMRPTEVLTAEEVLVGSLRTEGAERTAHEIRDTEAQRLGSLERLLAERDYLAAITTAPVLADILVQELGTERARAITDSNAWEALATTWRRAHHLDPERTAKILRLPITTPDPDDPMNVDGQLDLESLAVDEASILRYRLDRAVLAPRGNDPRDPLTGLATPIETTDPLLAEAATQNHDLITTRVDHLRALIPDINVAGLPARPADGDPLQSLWDHAALLAACYTDTWGEPLAVDAGTDERRARHRATVLARIRNWTIPPTPPAPPVIETDPWADPERIWFDADVLVEGWSLDLQSAIADAEAPEPPVDGEDIGIENATVPVPVAAVRGFTDYERRLVAANEAAWTHWTTTTPTSWVPDYLDQRGLPVADTTHTPAGWTSTFDALRAQGFTTDELLDAGLVTQTTKGSIIDRFRDRLALPIRDGHDRLVAFTARANPHTSDPKTPKYLNTPATSIYTKADLLYGLDAHAIKALNQGATPVLVEGAMDAEAIRTLGPDYVPLAPCGTALTPSQLTALDTLAPGSLTRLVIAFDPDDAGAGATLRTWDLLPASTRANARAARLDTGLDPGEYARLRRADDLDQALRDAPSLANNITSQILAANRTDHPETAIATTRHIAATIAPHLDTPVQLGYLAAQISRGLDYDLDPDTITTALLDAHHGISIHVTRPDAHVKEQRKNPIHQPHAPTVDTGLEIA